MAIFGKKDTAAKAPAKKATAKPAEEKSVDETAAPAAKKAEKKVVRGPLAKAHGGDSYRILVAPLVTEKTSRQQALNQYSFVVATGANKVEVAAAVRDLYGVKPAAVRIVNILGKTVRSGRSVGQRKAWKKAIVTLKPGETLSAFDA